jgi:hypothetical protein
VPRHDNVPAQPLALNSNADHSSQRIPSQTLVLRRACRAQRAGCRVLRTKVEHWAAGSALSVPMAPAAPAVLQSPAGAGGAAWCMRWCQSQAVHGHPSIRVRAASCCQGCRPGRCNQEKSISPTAQYRCQSCRRRGSAMAPARRRQILKRAARKPSVRRTRLSDVLATVLLHDSTQARGKAAVITLGP